MTCYKNQRIYWVNVIVLFSLPFLGHATHGQVIVAHRGASAAAPENTLAAFQLAWELGADVIEGDFYLTRDRQIVAIHDRTTKRTAGVDRHVSDSTLDELKKLDVGSWKSSRYQGERIPTIQEVFAIVPDDKKILIEIKCGAEIVPYLKKVLANSTLRPDQTVVISFQEEVIAACKREIPSIKAHWLTSYKRDKETGIWSPSHDSVLATLKRLGADGLDTQANEAVVDWDLVKRLRSAGLEFHAWTIDDPSVACRFQRLGVDSITTNRPSLIRDGLMTPGLKKHLQFHLKMDEDLLDSSGHDRHGVLTSESSTTNRFSDGVFGKALDLGKGDTAVRVPYTLPDAGSILFWYYTRSWYNYQTLLDNSVADDSWEMWIYNDGRLRFRNDPKASTLTHLFHPTGDVNEWHHIAVTWERRGEPNATDRLFVNGHLIQSATRTRSPSAKPGSLFFLGGGHPGNTKGNGQWDDVACFDIPLRQRDIRAIMTDGVLSLSQP